MQTQEVNDEIVTIDRMALDIRPGDVILIEGYAYFVDGVILTSDRVIATCFGLPGTRTPPEGFRKNVNFSRDHKGTWTVLVEAK